MGRFPADLWRKDHQSQPFHACRINDNMSVRMGIDFQRPDAELSNSAFCSAIADGTLGVNLQGLTTVNGDDNGWDWNSGALIKSRHKPCQADISRGNRLHPGGNVSFANVAAMLAARC